MGPVVKWGSLVLTAAILGPIILFAFLSWTSRRPTTLGPVAGKLRPCPPTPNCVCSCDPTPDHAIEPLPWKGDSREGLQRLADIIAKLPGGHCDPVEHDDYLHTEFTSALFRFVDDVEFLVDREAGVIHVRSASRVGRSDLGVNRHRIEQIRAQFSAARL